jgi:hypothetical protein
MISRADCKSLVLWCLGGESNPRDLAAIGF